MEQLIRDKRLGANDDVHYGWEDSQLVKKGKTIYQSASTLTVAKDAARNMRKEVPNNESGAMGVMFAGSLSLGAVSGEKSSVKAQTFKNTVAMPLGLVSVSRDPITKDKFLSLLSDKLKLETPEENVIAEKAVTETFETEDWTCAAPKLVVEAVENDISGPFFMSEVWFGADKSPWKQEQPMASCTEHCAKFLSLLINGLKNFASSLSENGFRPMTSADRVIEQRKKDIQSAIEFQNLQKVQTQQKLDSVRQEKATLVETIGTQLSDLVHDKQAKGYYMDTDNLAGAIIGRANELYESYAVQTAGQRKVLTQYEQYHFTIRKGEKGIYQLSSDDRGKSEDALRVGLIVKMKESMQKAFDKAEAGPEELTDIAIDIFND